MNEITEIVPDDMPQWARDAFAEGQFFRMAIAKIEQQRRAFEDIQRELGVPDESYPANVANAYEIARNSNE